MKKLVLTMVALVAMATSSFAQYFTVYTPVGSYQEIIRLGISLLITRT